MRKLREEGPIIKEISDLMLARVWCQLLPLGGDRSHYPRLGDVAEEEMGRDRPRQGCDAWARVPSASQFDGSAREELQQVAAQFCSYQSIALELIKTKQRKESRFQLFMQVSPWPPSAFPHRL